MWLIISGYINWIYYSLFPEKEKNVSKKRLLICQQCEFKHKKRRICTICGCPIGAITRARYPKRIIGKKRKGCKKNYW